jgi:hypothetical protein
LFTSPCALQASDDIVVDVLTFARKRLVRELEKRQEMLEPRFKNMPVCGFHSSVNVYAERTTVIARKRLEITLRKWTAVWRIVEAQAALRAAARAEKNEQEAMLRTAAENLRLGISTFAYVTGNQERLLIVERPEPSSWPLLDFFRNLLITKMQIESDNKGLLHLDNEFMIELKDSIRFEASLRWKARTRQECAVLASTISGIDLVLAMMQMRLSH